jgi:hypothetical protein
LTISEAVNLLDAPYHESPHLIDTARPAFSYGLFLLLPAAFVVAASVFVVRFVLPTITLPRW